MHLVQILLPLYDNEGRRFPEAAFGSVRYELATRFGGVTAYSRAPAEGLWTEGSQGTARDDILLFEVMVERLDRVWWRGYCAGLERRFRQDEIVIRAQEIERL